MQTAATTKKEQYILNHLNPIEYGFHRYTYFCGVSINNKDRFIHSIGDTVKRWVEKNGGVFKILSGKIINHKLKRKGLIVQITFPCTKGAMKNIMSTLY